MYSINGDVEGVPLREPLLTERSDTLLTQNVQRQSIRDSKIQSFASKSSLKAQEAERIEDEHLEDTKTVLKNFLSKPTQFKFNKTQTRLIAISEPLY